MIPHPTDFSANGFRFTQVAREGPIALFRRCKPGGAGHFELVRLREVEASEIYGRDYPAREVYPGNEKWGTDGFTVMDEKEARKRFGEMAGEENQP